MLGTILKSRPLLPIAAFILTAGLTAFAAQVEAQGENCSDCGAAKPAPVTGTELRKSRESRRAPRSGVTRIAKTALARAKGGIGEPQEKSVAVLPGVYVTLCVARGAVRVNGWDRNEVRAFHAGGKDLGIRVLERGKEKKPAWVEVLGYEPESPPAKAEKCLIGDIIELDVPVGASVTLKGLSSETSIVGVKKASIEIVGGDIFLNDISDSIDARTQQGGVTVNNSGGKMALETTTGNIVAFNTEAVEPGDYFKAKTRSGAVTMQSIGQKQIAASSISGSINYVGDIKNYGRYEFTTTEGILNIVIPQTSSYWLTAAYGGRFISDFQVKVIREEETESLFYLYGRVGSGEANLTLKSYSGTIRLRKRELPDEYEKPVIP